MRIIAHRGNTEGPDPKWENDPAYIDRALGLGFDVEVDVWVDRRQWYLGHDHPHIPIAKEWLLSRADNLWVHAKSFETLDALVALAHLGYVNPLLNFFWHTGKEDYVLTSRGWVWSLPGRGVGECSVVVDLPAGLSYNEVTPYGVCTDYPVRLRESCPS